MLNYMKKGMSMENSSSPRVYPEGPPQQSPRADQELEAIKSDGLKGRHALELRIQAIETHIPHLATKADLEQAKARLTLSLIGMVTSLIAAIGSVIAAISVLSS